MFFLNFIGYYCVSSLVVAKRHYIIEEKAIVDIFSVVTRYKCDLFSQFYTFIYIAYQHYIKNPSLKVSFGSSFDF